MPTLHKFPTTHSEAQLFWDEDKTRIIGFKKLPPYQVSVDPKEFSPTNPDRHAYRR